MKDILFGKVTPCTLVNKILPIFQCKVFLRVQSSRRRPLVPPKRVNNYQNIRRHIPTKPGPKTPQLYTRRDGMCLVETSAGSKRL